MWMNELPAQFQPESRLVPLTQFKRLQSLGDLVQRFRKMAVLYIPASKPGTSVEEAVTAVRMIGFFVVGVDKLSCFGRQNAKRTSSHAKNTRDSSRGLVVRPDQARHSHLELILRMP